MNIKLPFICDLLLGFSWFFPCSSISQSKHIISNHSPIHACVPRYGFPNLMHSAILAFFLILDLHLFWSVSLLLFTILTFFSKEIIHDFFGDWSMINLFLGLHPNNLCYFFILNLRKICKCESIEWSVTFHWLHIRTNVNLIQSNQIRGLSIGLSKDVLRLYWFNVSLVPWDVCCFLWLDPLFLLL